MEESDLITGLAMFLTAFAALVLLVGVVWLTADQ